MKDLSININDLYLENKEFTVFVSATYKLPIAYLGNDKGVVKIDTKHKSTLEKLVMDHLSSQMFSDAFGRLPAECFGVTKIDGHPEVQKQFDIRIKEAIAQFEKTQLEEKKLRIQKEKLGKKERIKLLKKELAELQKSVR